MTGEIKEGSEKQEGVGGNVQNSWFIDIVMLIA